MPTAKKDRWLVFGGIVIAELTSILFIWAGFDLTRNLKIFQEKSSLEAMAFAILIATIPLIAGIGWVAMKRHMVSNIDGSPPLAGSSLDLTLRYVLNTLEQLVLFCVACIGAAILVPEMARNLLPVMGCWFLLARSAFFIGYQIHPLARAIGFAATFHPTVVLIVYAIVAFLI